MPPVQLVFATTGRQYLHGCHSFCNTWANTAQKMIMMNANLLLKLLHVLLRKVGKKVSSVEGNEEYVAFFVIELIAAPGAVHLAKPSRS